MKRKTISRALVAGLTLLLTPMVLEAAGGSSSPALPTPERTPADEAKAEYERGLRFRDKAWKLEEKAASATNSKERGKLELKVQKEFKKAVRAFGNATKANPGMFQAFSSLGYALRRTGDYEAALEAYDRALALEPRYTEATEYRGEAYLGLNRLAEAKQAYLHLFRADRERAEELIAAMKTWVDKRSSEPGELDRATIDSFAAWVEERSQISEQTASLFGSETSSW